MGKFAKGLIESMQQAARHAAGTKVRGLRVSKIELPDVKAVSTSPSLRANGSRERAPDDRLREAIHLAA